jgi:hypothetical protein
MATSSASESFGALNTIVHLAAPLFDQAWPWAPTPSHGGLAAHPGCDFPLKHSSQSLHPRHTPPELAWRHCARIKGTTKNRTYRRPVTSVG